MKKQVLLILGCLLFGLSGSGRAQQVEIFGALKKIVHGDLSAKIDLKDLPVTNNLYGLGPVENLKGEITIIAGKPSIAKVDNNNVVIDTSYNSKAAMLVYAKVNEWKHFKSQKEISSIADFERYFSELLTENNVESERVIPFLMADSVNSLSWHVVDWVEGDTVHTHAKHRASGLHGTIKNEPVEIIGFFSKNHHGVFTHKSSNIHIHFIKDDKKLSGHVDDLGLRKGTIISIGQK